MLIAVVSHQRVYDKADFVQVVHLEALPHEHNELFVECGRIVDFFDAVLRLAILFGNAA